MTDLTDPTAAPARLATQPEGLDLGALALLGTFGPADAPAALLRQPGGAVRRIAPGDAVRGAVVDRIDPGRVVLRRGTSLTALVLPGQG